jgi:hypothetical protein
LAGLFKWGDRKADAPAPAPTPRAASTDTLVTSKVFPRFLAALAHQSKPVLLDLGPVVGSNITFFGERFACKIFVEDLFADVEACARRGEPGAFGRISAERLTQEPGTIDGILCWDLFDFLDRPAGQALARRLVQLVRPGGALYGLFGTTAVDLRHYTRFVVEREDALRLRTYPATQVRRNVLMTRDIIKMFDGLAVAESVLLKSSARETLFRRS